MSAWPEQSLPADFSANRIQDLAFTTLDRADFDALMDWCDFEGWNPGEPVFEVARMVHGPTPAWPADRMCGVTSYELG